MRTTFVWVIIVLLAVAGVTLFLALDRQSTNRELRRIERGSAGLDTSRIPLIVTPAEAAQRRAGFQRRARELSDSADALHAELVRLHGRLTESDEKRVSRLYARARELDSLSRVSGTASITDQRKLELYESCVLAYGAGRQQCREIRSVIENERKTGR